MLLYCDDSTPRSACVNHWTYDCPANAWTCARVSMSNSKGLHELGTQDTTSPINIIHLHADVLERDQCRGNPSSYSSIPITLASLELLKLWTTLLVLTLNF